MNGTEILQYVGGSILFALMFISAYKMSKTDFSGHHKPNK